MFTNSWFPNFQYTLPSVSSIESACKEQELAPFPVSSLPTKVPTPEIVTISLNPAVFLGLTQFFLSNKKSNTMSVTGILVVFSIPVVPGEALTSST